MPGILARVFDRSAETRGVTAITPPSLVEGDWLRGVGMPATRTGVQVTQDSALTLSAVWACIRVIADTLGSVPLITYRPLPDGGKVRASTDPVYRLLHDAPNGEMTAVEFRALLQAHLDLRGNAYINVVRDGAYRPIQLWPLNPDRMRVIRQPDGDLVYLYRLPSGEDRILALGRDVVHLRGLSLDGVMGLSVLAIARESLGLSLASEHYGAGFFGNSSRPSGVLKTSMALSDEAQARLRSSWDSLYRGLDNAHRVAILEEGLEWQQIGLSNEDAQYLQTREFQLLEVCRWFGVPPHLIGELGRATWGNTEQMATAFVVNALRPRAVRLEQALNRHILASPLYCEHLFDGLLRGDSTARAEVYSKSLTAGWMTANEVRARENLNPMAGGDVLRAPLYTAPADGDDGQPAAGGHD